MYLYESFGTLEYFILRTIVTHQWTIKRVETGNTATGKGSYRLPVRAGRLSLCFIEIVI